MDTGIYIALSKEIGIFRDMEVTANDIANTTTTGFRAENVLFSQYLVPSTRQEHSAAFSNDVSSYRNLAQGTLQVTSNPLDAAIEGKGFFAVNTPLGTRYTRNGNFKIDPTGQLVTSDGYVVQDDSGQAITFDDTDRVISILEDGTVNVDNSPRAALKVVQFDNDQLLQPVGNALYKSDIAPKPAEDVRIVNGALERSNVQPFAALTHMLYVSRSATDTANFINTMYTLERNASNTLAKIYN